MKEPCRLLGIKQNISTAYHPRTDGQSEQSNQWLEQYLQFWVNHQQQDWHHYLPLAKFTHNSWPHEVTKSTPFELMMGHNPRAEIIDTISSMLTVALRINLWKQAQKRANELIIQAQSRWRKARDKKVEFNTGDKVWLKGQNLKSDQPSIKLSAKWYGPFKITKVLSPITYQLQVPLSWKIHDVFHIDLLTPYKETEMHGPNFIEPPPDLIDGEEEYEVEAILDSRRWGRGHKLQYLIKWKGYSEAENQWVDAKDVHADQLVDQFQKKLVRHIKAEPIHCRRTITPMSNNASTVSEPELFALSFQALNDDAMTAQGRAKPMLLQRSSNLGDLTFPPLGRHLLSPRTLVAQMATIQTTARPLLHFHRTLSIFPFCLIFYISIPFPLSFADYIRLLRSYLLSLITLIFNWPLSYLVAVCLSSYQRCVCYLVQYIDPQSGGTEG